MPIPDETRDRWDNRAEPDSGKGVIYWHVMFRDNPAVRATAKEANARRTRSLTNSGTCSTWTSKRRS